MKTMSILALVLTFNLVHSFAEAKETPYARTCRLKGGRPWVLNLQTKDEIVLCVFNSAAIGAPEFAAYRWRMGTKKSLDTFLGQTSQLNSNSVCQDFGAVQQTSQDSEGNPWRICVFADKSVIEVETLANGVHFPGNDLLVQALR